MIGGLLCERTVEDVMPALVTNKEQVRFDASMLTCLFEAGTWDTSVHRNNVQNVFSVDESDRRFKRPGDEEGSRDKRVQGEAQHQNQRTG